jgi:hypothetical protein
MNRMSPLITRAATLRAMQPRHSVEQTDYSPDGSSSLGEDLQFFLTAWLATFLFLGTLFS